LKILVQKFGGTSVDSEESRSKATGKIVRAIGNGWSVVVVVSAIGRDGAPYATDTLVKFLKSVDSNTLPAAREMDMMMACGEIMSTVVMAQTLRARGYETIALTGGQAGIATDYEFGNARIISIDPAYVVRMLEVGKIVFVAGFQGVTEYGAVTTLGRGGSDTTASALGAALKPYAKEIAVEIYTDVDGVRTADPRQVKEARRLNKATYEEVAEMAHLGAKVVHPRAAEIAHLYRIPLWVKSTFADAEGTLITADEDCDDKVQQRVTGITHTGKIVYLRFPLPANGEIDKGQVEMEIYRILQKAAIPLYLNSTDGNAFAFAVAREHLPTLINLLNGLAIPVENRTNGVNRVYLLGLGQRNIAFETQRILLEKASSVLDVRAVEAEVTNNCTVVSVISGRFRGIPGVTARMLEALARVGVPVYQTADSPLSVSVLVPEEDAGKATRALHVIFELATEDSVDGRT
jgi:aspartate kinase